VGDARAPGLLALLASGAAVVACGSSDGAANSLVPKDPAGVPEDVVVSADALKALSELRYDSAPPPADPSNRVADDEKARLFGQRLFFDTSLSGALLEGDNDGSSSTLGNKGDAGRVSCAGCHVPESGFVDTRSPHGQISLAAQWTARRAPTLLEVTFAPLYNWDGRRDSIWGQAIGVMESDREFNSGRLFIAEQIEREHQAEYESVFGPLPPLTDAAHFPALLPSDAGCVEVRTMSGSVFKCRGKPGDGADYDALAPEDQRAVTSVIVNVAKAIAAYVRQLRCGPSRFDAWLDGKGQGTELGASERRGAALFVGRAGCVKCHSGSNLTDYRFHNVGLSPATVAVAFVDTNDQGAAKGIADALQDPLNTSGDFSDGDRHALPATPGPELLGAFRTPTLRCIGNQPSFMHTGQMKTLAEVVLFHDRGGDPAGNYPGQNELTPLGLTETEQGDLVAFLGALKGDGPSTALLGTP
jgi:cytochrome c peroxidase